MTRIAAAQTDARSDTDARAFFDQGRAAYEAGQFDEAARAFRRAYVLSPRFALLYNIGQAELRAGRDQLAIEAFEGYLRQAPADDPRRSEVEERARVLHSMGIRAEATDVTAESQPETVEPPQATEAAPTPTEHQATEPVSDDEGGANIAPWILVGGGAAVVVAGVVMMAVGGSKAGNVTDAADGTRWSEVEGDASSANVFWGVGLGLTGLGLAAAGVGLVWGLGGDSPAESNTASNTMAQLRVGVGSLMIEGEF